MQYKDLAVVREPLEAQLAEKRGQLNALQAQSGGINLGTGKMIEKIDDIVGGDNVLRDKIIKNFFGSEPGKDGEKLLHVSLDALVGDCNQLRLSRLTTNCEILVYQRDCATSHIQKLLKRTKFAKCSADVCQPEDVRLLEIGDKAVQLEDGKFILFFIQR